ncbi:MAG: response regulator [Alphaproteobacteria bacterium]|nr:response regulator [Alphaproteobacteria bacterium]MCL2505165.1 response regulator [Alphaproteobacteria bacterium]
MKTCLIIDDSRVIRKIIRQILESLGYICKEAIDGKIALADCAETMPDLVILDWNMPVMNGYDFLIALRQMQDGDLPVVIFCTTESSTASIEKAMLGGVNEYMVKPFDADLLKSKLTKLGLL